MTPRRTLSTACIFLALLHAHAGAQQQAQQEAQEGARPYDPYHAEKAVEVGLFYMKKGDLDAAIDRFRDAIGYKANFARPRLLLGEAYEKKGDSAQALKYYKEYIEILPNGPDSKKVRSRIQKMSRQQNRRTSAAAQPSGKSP